MTKSKIRNLVIALFLASASAQAWAWDGVVSGTVGTTEVTHGENYAYRVHLQGKAEGFCGSGTMNWAYINASESNYNTYVSALLAAKFSKVPVSLYLIRIGQFCRIGHMSF